jgi:hypothetical protein
LLDVRGIIEMPTVLRSGPYRFYFYAGDQDEPEHIHVERDDSEAKFWLEPIRLARSHGFAAKELKSLERVVEDNRQFLLEQWHEFFDN